MKKIIVVFSFIVCSLVFSETRIFSTEREVVESITITADPQYPWTPSNNQESEEDCKRISEQLISEQFDSMAINSSLDMARYNVTQNSLVINGDITAFGHKWQRNKMNELLNKAKFHFNLFYGLGNHDYENNVNDSYLNNCFDGSVFDYIRHVENNQKFGFIRSFDCSKTKQVFQDHVYGSLAYRAKVGTFNIIQLNNHPKYEKQVYTGVAQSGKYHIVNSLNWLDKTLSEIGDEPVIIMSHQSPESQEFNTLMKKYRNKIICIFLGHTHTIGCKGTIEGIPIIFSGTPINKNYLQLIYFPIQKRLELYQINNNDCMQNKRKIYDFKNITNASQLTNNIKTSDGSRVRYNQVYTLRNRNMPHRGGAMGEIYNAWDYALLANDTSNKGWGIVFEETSGNGDPYIDSLETFRIRSEIADWPKYRHWSIIKGCPRLDSSTRDVFIAFANANDNFFAIGKFKYNNENGTCDLLDVDKNGKSWLNFNNNVKIYGEIPRDWYLECWQ
ncbi:metallophosphoesterase family protein [Enterococcus avium]|uniref:metallophosphoesterase family protein n=1 Tax=Enterococcus avium TaxID=33945 RepID=UPI001F56440A|nr:metallophosphoesterase [Enterococcus avium]